MIFNVLVVVLVLGIAAMWGMRGKGRGLFSSMLACVCVIVSGAVAFALWEPLTYKFLLNANEDMAFGLALVIPFAITLLITRLLAEALVPKNLEFGDAANFVGGAAFGLVSGVITAGILVLALSFFRFGPSIMGYTAVSEKQGGSLVYTKSLWIPVDKFTVKLYEHLSAGAFSTPTPLASIAPNLYVQAGMQRMVYTANGTGGTFTARNAIKGDEFAIKGRYEVMGSDATSYDLINASGQAERKNQTILYPNGEPAPASGKVEGFLVEFQSQAGEKSGQVVIGPGQIRLVGQKANGEAFGVQPFAIIASPTAGSGQMHRFPLDSSGVFLSSVGGGSSAFFGFEFVIPQDAEATQLIVKNFRVPLKNEPIKAQYASGEKRDESIKSGDMFPKFGVTIGGLANVDKSGSVDVLPQSKGDFREIKSTSYIPMGFVVTTTTGTKGLEVTEFGKEKYVTGGQGQFLVDDLRQRGIERNLQVERFATKRDTGIVEVTLKENGNATKVGRAVEASNESGPPRLIDTQGRAYDAIGYVYSEGGTVYIKFTPGDPMKGMKDLPAAISSSKGEQSIVLIFQPTEGVTIDGFLLGTKQLVTFKDGLTVRAQH